MNIDWAVLQPIFWQSLWETLQMVVVTLVVGGFFGLVIGVLFAAGVVWYIHKTPPPFSNKAQPSPSGVQTAPDGSPIPLALPGKPGDPAPQNGDKPRFDFYKILPGSAEAVPDPKSADAKTGE